MADTETNDQECELRASSHQLMLTWIPFASMHPREGEIAGDGHSTPTDGSIPLHYVELLHSCHILFWSGVFSSPNGCLI